jgi:hypothetical protein
LATIVAVLLSTLSWPLAGLNMTFIFAMVLTVLWQLSWVWRYFPLAPVEVETCSEAPDSPKRLSLLTTNPRKIRRGC